MQQDNDSPFELKGILSFKCIFLQKKKQSPYANYRFFRQIWKQFHVHQGCHHTLQRTKLRINA